MSKTLKNRRLFALLICTIMVLRMMPVTALADGLVVNREAAIAAGLDPAAFVEKRDFGSLFIRTL